MKSQDITVIITSFHSGEKIFDCINSIDEKVKVIVIENSNDYLLQKKIESKYSNVKCILSKENLGYGAGNNLGLSKVKTNFALIINPDVNLKDNSLDNFFLTINKIGDFGIIAPLSRSEKYENFNFDTDKEIKEVDYVKGFAMFMNMKNFKKVGFFDENFFLYFEEIDLCKRLQNNKIKVYIDPSIEVSHLGGTSHDVEINKPMELSRNWHWMWSSFYYYKKHYGYMTAILKILPKLISSMIKFIIYSFIFKKFKKDIYKHRILGIINSVLLKKSWYRPKF